MTSFETAMAMSVSMSSDTPKFIKLALYLFVTISLMLYSAVVRMWSVRRSISERLAFQDSIVTRVLLAGSIRVAFRAHTIGCLTTITFLNLYFVLANAFLKFVVVVAVIDKAILAVALTVILLVVALIVSLLAEA